MDQQVVVHLHGELDALEVHEGLLEVALHEAEQVESFFLGPEHEAFVLREREDELEVRLERLAAGLALDAVEVDLEGVCDDLDHLRGHVGLGSGGYREALEEDAHDGGPLRKLVSSDGVFFPGDFYLVEHVVDLVEVLEVEHVAEQPEVDHDHLHEQRVFEVHVA